MMGAKRNTGPIAKEKQQQYEQKQTAATVQSAIDEEPKKPEMREINKCKMM